MGQASKRSSAHASARKRDGKATPVKKAPRKSPAAKSRNRQSQAQRSNAKSVPLPPADAPSVQSAVPITSVFTPPQGPSPRTPTGRKTRHRTFLCYHNPENSQVTLHQLRSGSVQTYKRLRDLERDTVWIYSRDLDNGRFYLHSRFVVECVTAIKKLVRGKTRTKLVIQGTNSFYLDPMIELTDIPWFVAYRARNGLSHGFQSVRGQDALEWLEALWHRCAVGSPPMGRWAIERQ